MAASLIPVRGRERGASRAARAEPSAVEGSDGMWGGVQRERQKKGGVLRSRSERTRREEWNGEVAIAEDGRGGGGGGLKGEDGRGDGAEGAKKRA